MILGVVLAGGQSSRFGSDKALATLHGRSLLERAVGELDPYCDAVVVAGRDNAPVETIPDWPVPGMGPLGGIAAGLRHANDAGFTSVMTCGVDSVQLPENLLELLSPAPAYLESQPVIGHWNSDAASTVEAILQGEGRHSMLAFAGALNARSVKLASKPANINTPADLAAAENRHGI